jgi:iron-sulfur cluster assembly protein
VVTLTDAASRKLAEVLAQQSEHGKSYLGLRVSAMSGCCSGPQYGMSLAESTEDGDWIGEVGGIKLLVDAGSAPLLEGTRIDYIETERGAGFTIENPNAARETGTGGDCACGRGGCGGH